MVSAVIPGTAGGRIANGVVALCAGCGIVAPSRGASCIVCKRPFDTPRRTVAIRGDVVWVALRCTFPCRSCGFPSPLEGVELDAGVNCAQCGAFQRFDKSGWADGLTFAHEIGDLAGPSPEGLFPHPRLWIGDDNPHRWVGNTTTFASKDFGTLHVEAAPGFPSCGACRVPLEVRVEGNFTSSRCPSCGDAGRYEVPAEAFGFARALRAIVAPEQRVDRRAVRVQQTQAGLVALQCPQCGAAVRPTETDTVECSFCRTVSFLPARLRMRGGGQIVEPPIFWVAFQGPSDKRGELELLKPGPASKTAKGLLSRGIAPLPGIELAPPRRGFDHRQFLLTTGLTALAMVLGFGLLLTYRLLE